MGRDAVLRFDRSGYWGYTTVLVNNVMPNTALGGEFN